ncbi:MAG: hypothetical protein IJP13_02840 [Lachnospiraceae bacterium]|nr:hypothetical protein [Lachnospiraceae bacterium]
MSLVACGETNSTEEEETATEMRPDIDQTYEITIEDLIIKENDKEIYGKIYTPDAEGTFPTIIMCHGYNGCHAELVIINGEAHGFTPATGKQAMEKVLEFMRNHY